MSANVVPLPSPARPIDRPVTITTFRNEFAKTKTENVIRFRKIAERIPNHTAVTKGQLQYMKLASFGDKPTPEAACLRTNENMRWIDGVELDCDEGGMQPHTARDRFARAGIATIVYSTPSYTHAKPRWRALLPTSKSLAPEQREALAAIANGIVNGAASNAETFTQSQAFHYGQVLDADRIKIYLVDGDRFIDQAPDLVAGAIGKDGKPYEQRPVDDDGFGDHDVSPRDLPAWVPSALHAIDAVEVGNNYFQWTSDIGMSLHYGSGGSDEGLELFHEFSARTDHYNAAEVEAKWKSYGRQQGKLKTLGTIWYLAEKHYNWVPPKRDNKVEFDPESLTLDAWMERDIPPRDPLLGEIIDTTTRAFLVAPTGIGKTNLATAMAFAIGNGSDFLHWEGTGKPRRVLYIDGEMSRRVFKKRLGDAIQRHGKPAGFYAFSSEEFPDMQPLNTKAGQDYIDNLAERIGGVELIVFDNVQALIPGDLKDTEAWQAVLPWTRAMTARAVGQLWVHHTGINETRAYGDSTREWPFDTVMLMERAPDDFADISFRLTFTKARERDPDNRADFNPVKIILADDTWTSETACARVKLTPKRQAALDILVEPMTVADWREACIASPKVTAAETRKARLVVFSQIYQKLAQDNFVATGADGMVSRVSTTEVINDDVFEC